MHLRNVFIGSLATAALFVAGSHEALAQTGQTVQIGSPTAQVLSRPNAGGDLLLTANEGDRLDLLNREGEWYWVMLPRDVYGASRAGWIHGAAVAGSEFRAAAEQKAFEEAQAKAEKELQKIERQQAKEAAEEARRLKQTQDAAAKDDAARAKQQDAEAREAAEENRRLRDAADQLDKARREYENSIKSAQPPATSRSVPHEAVVSRSVAAADFGEAVQP